MGSVRNFSLGDGHIIIGGFIAEFVSGEWPYYHLWAHCGICVWGLVLLSLVDSLRNLSLETGQIIIGGPNAEFVADDWSDYH